MDNQKYEAHFGIEVQIPSVDKTGHRWTCDDLEEVFTTEGHVSCSSTGGIIDTSGPPALIRKDDGKMYRNPEAHHHVIDAQGYTLLTDREEIEDFLNRLLQRVNAIFVYDGLNECPKVDYWLWVYPESSTLALLYERCEDTGLWKKQEEHDKMDMPATLNLDQLSIMPGWSESK